MNANIIRIILISSKLVMSLIAAFLFWSINSNWLKVAGAIIYILINIGTFAYTGNEVVMRILKILVICLDVILLFYFAFLSFTLFKQIPTDGDEGFARVFMVICIIITVIFMIFNLLNYILFKNK